jgi:hypothetical protein
MLHDHVPIVAISIRTRRERNMTRKAKV